MIIDQASQNGGTENSEASSQTSKATDQSTSTTGTDKADGDEDESIDLGTGKGDAAEEQGGGEQEDTRTDEEKAADETAKAEHDKLFGAPEGDTAYEISGLPEGTEIDTNAVDALTPLAKQLNLSNEGFSALAQVYAEKVLPGVAEKIVGNLNADALAKRKEWEGEARDLVAGKGEALKTKSGEPINFNGLSLGETQKLAAKALDKFAPAGFREWLDETGLGVHPQMIAFAFNIGKDTAEDREVEHSDTGGGKKKSDGRPMTDASKFYNH